MRIEESNSEWDDAFRMGHRLVIRAMRPGEGGEEDVALAKLAAKALLLGLDSERVSDCLRCHTESFLEEFIRIHTH